MDLNQKQISRRKVLAFIGSDIFWSTISANLVSLGRDIVPNTPSNNSLIFNVGSFSDYSSGVSVKYLSSHKVWIINDNEIIYALITSCCNSEWLSETNNFICNCDGSTFNISGSSNDGLSAGAMERVKIEIGKDGQIIIDKSIKFSYEKGEFNNTQAFIKIVNFKNLLQ